MKEVWRLDKATVRDVYEALREKRTIAYTTVMTMMKILEDKGYLKKIPVGSRGTCTGRHGRGSRSLVPWCAISSIASLTALRGACCCTWRGTAS